MHINYDPFDASGLCNVEKISTGDCTCIIDTLCINNALSSAVTSLLFLKGGVIKRNEAAWCSHGACSAEVNMCAGLPSGSGPVFKQCWSGRLNKCPPICNYANLTHRKPKNHFMCSITVMTSHITVKVINHKTATENAH